MAGHPLRPATRQRLGRPSPHQQTNRTRAHPPPPKLSKPHDAARSEHSVLAVVSNCYPKVKGRLLTRYSPVRHSCTPEGALPFNLHVLSTPPAFALSQDQTLHQKTERKKPSKQKLDKINPKTTQPNHTHNPKQGHKHNQAMQKRT